MYWWGWGRGDCRGGAGGKWVGPCPGGEWEVGGAMYWRGVEGRWGYVLEGNGR